MGGAFGASSKAADTLRHSGIEILRNSLDNTPYSLMKTNYPVPHIKKASQPPLKAQGKAEPVMVSKIRMGALPDFYAAQVSDKGLGTSVRGYAANSHRGNIKPFNEDRISIVTKLSNEFPDVSIFAVYDGHGGQGCAEYLRE